MLTRIGTALRGLLANFGPMVVFMVVVRVLSIRWAIALSMLWTVAELAWCRVRKQPPTRIFLFTAAMTLAFGAIDLYQNAPVFLKWEAVLTNIITGLYFGATVFSGKSLIQEFYERSQGVTELPRPELADYFRAFTGVWAGYFFVKAIVYAWLAQRYSFERALAIRAVVGSVSFYALLGVSTVLGRPLFNLARRFGLFAPKAAPAPATQAPTAETPPT